MLKCSKFLLWRLQWSKYSTICMDLVGASVARASSSSHRCILCAAVAGPQATPILLIAYNCLVDVYFLISSNITGGLLIKHGWLKERAWVWSARPERELKGGWGGDKERRSGGITQEEMTGGSWHCQPPHIKAEHVSLNVTLSHCRKEHQSKTAYNNTTRIWRREFGVCVLYLDVCYHCSCPHTHLRSLMCGEQTCSPTSKVHQP